MIRWFGQKISNLLYTNECECTCEKEWCLVTLDYFIDALPNPKLPEEKKRYSNTVSFLCFCRHQDIIKGLMNTNVESCQFHFKKTEHKQTSYYEGRPFSERSASYKRTGLHYYLREENLDKSYCYVNPFSDKIFEKTFKFRVCENYSFRDIYTRFREIASLLDNDFETTKTLKANHVIEGIGKKEGRGMFKDYYGERF